MVVNLTGTSEGTRGCESELELLSVTPSDDDDDDDDFLGVDELLEPPFSTGLRTRIGGC